MESFGQLQQQMSTWEADREAKRREMHDKLKKLTRQGRLIKKSLGKSSYQ